MRYSIAIHIIMVKTENEKKRKTHRWNEARWGAKRNCCFHFFPLFLVLWFYLWFVFYIFHAFRWTESKWDWIAVSRTWKFCWIIAMGRSIEIQFTSVHDVFAANDAYYTYYHTRAPSSSHACMWLLTRDVHVCACTRVCFRWLCSLMYLFVCD